MKRRMATGAQVRGTFSLSQVSGPGIPSASLPGWVIEPWKPSFCCQAEYDLRSPVPQVSLFVWVSYLLQSTATNRACIAAMIGLLRPITKNDLPGNVTKPVRGSVECTYDGRPYPAITSDRRVWRSHLSSKLPSIV